MKNGFFAGVILPARLAIPVFLLIATLTASQAGADLVKGRAAYDRSDFHNAFTEFLTAAKAGDPAGMNAVALLYETGRVTAKNLDEAAMWHRRAADLGSADSAYALVRMHDHDGPLKDAKASHSWYERAAQLGHSAAKAILAMLHETGQHAHTQGAASELGELKAAKLYRQAADGGDPGAASRLGLFHLRGKGVDQSDPEAARRFRSAAEGGDLAAMFHLGLMLEAGRGVKRSTPDAVRWWRRAADLGDVDSAFNLGLVLFKNLDQTGLKSQAFSSIGEEALARLSFAAGAGDVDAMLELGRLYSQGSIIKSDPGQAASWWRRAAESGSVRGMYLYGLACDSGFGERLDQQAAGQWWLRAAKAGFAPAQTNLGVLYAEGLGVKASLPLAYAWTYAAAQAGESAAKTNLATLETTMPREEIDSAVRAARARAPGEVMRLDKSRSKKR